MFEGIKLQKPSIYSNYVDNRKVNTDGSCTIQLNDGQLFRIKVQNGQGEDKAFSKREWKEITSKVIEILEKKNITTSRKEKIPSISSSIDCKGVRYGAQSIKHKVNGNTVKEFDDLHRLINGRVAAQKDVNSVQGAAGRGVHASLDSSSDSESDSVLDNHSIASNGSQIIQLPSDDSGNESDTENNVLGSRGGHRHSSNVRDQIRLMKEQHAQQIDALNKQVEAVQNANKELVEQFTQANTKKDEALERALEDQRVFVAKALENTSPEKLAEVQAKTIQQVADALAPQNQQLNTTVEKLASTLAEAIRQNKPSDNVVADGQVGDNLQHNAVSSVQEAESVKALADAIRDLVAASNVQNQSKVDEVKETLQRLEDKLNVQLSASVTDEVRQQVEALKEQHEREVHNLNNIHNKTQYDNVNELERLNHHITQLIATLGNNAAEQAEKSEKFEKISSLEKDIIEIRQQLAGYDHSSEAIENMRQSMEANFERLFSLLGGRVSDRASAEEVERLNSEIERITKIVDVQRDELNAQQHASSENEKLRRKLNELNARLEQSNETNRRLSDQIQQLTQQNSNLQAHQNQEFERLSEQLAAKERELNAAYHQLNQQENLQSRDIVELRNDNALLHDLINKLRKENDTLHLASNNREEAIRQLQEQLNAAKIDTANWQNEANLKDNIIEGLRTEIQDAASRAKAQNDLIGNLSIQLEDSADIIKQLENDLNTGAGIISDLEARLADADAHRGITPAEVSDMMKQLREMYTGSARVTRAAMKSQVRRRICGTKKLMITIDGKTRELTPDLEKAIWFAFGADSQYKNVITEVTAEKEKMKEIKKLDDRIRVLELAVVNAKSKLSDEEAQQITESIEKLKLAKEAALELPEDYVQRDSNHKDKEGQWFVALLGQRLVELTTQYEKIKNMNPKVKAAFSKKPEIDLI